MTFAALFRSVSSSGGKVDHGHYTQNVGGADIFFATDFRWLASAYTSVMEDGADAEVLSSRAFLEMHVNPERTETRTGYNPMLEDYANTAFLTGHSRAPQRVHSSLGHSPNPCPRPAQMGQRCGRSAPTPSSSAPAHCGQSRAEAGRAAGSLANP